MSILIIIKKYSIYFYKLIIYERDKTPYRIQRPCSLKTSLEVTMTYGMNYRMMIYTNRCCCQHIYVVGNVLIIMLLKSIR